MKPLLLSGAAFVVVGLQPAVSQDRTQSPAAQERPAQNPNDAQPESRRERGSQPAAPGQSQTKPQNEPRAAQQPSSDPSAQDREQRRNAQSPKVDKQRQQTRDDEGAREKKARPQNNERSRQRDQARDADGPRDREQVRDRDSDRNRGRDQPRDPERRQDREDARSGDDRSNQREVRENRRPDDRQAAQPTEQQRTRISASIRQAKVQPVRNVNFSISIGAAVPATLRLYPITPAIVEVYPQYRGYSFVVVEEEIVIIQPRTRKIVTVIETGGGRAASRSRGKLTLTDTQRDVIRRSAIERRTTGSGRASTIEREYVIGDDIPETVEIESFPETVYTEIPEIRSYRYVVRERDVYVIDPLERRVIEIVR